MRRAGVIANTTRFEYANMLFVHAIKCGICKLEHIRAVVVDVNAVVELHYFDNKTSEHDAHNVLRCVHMGKFYDKHCAMHARRRVNEPTLRVPVLSSFVRQNVYVCVMW